MNSILFFSVVSLTLAFSRAFSLFERPFLRTLLIDNFDSYTYNIWQQVAEVNSKEPLVIHNNAFSSWNELTSALPPFDNIILSPGPGSPEISKDFGLCRDAISYSTVPILGVCLGHQGIGLHYGGKVTRANTPMHGRLSKIYHHQSELFEGLPNATDVVRYHSLIVDQLPGCLKCTAWTDDGTVMAVQHDTKPHFGVQFHPESIKTEFGKQIFQNFRKLSINYMKQHRSATTSTLPKFPHRLVDKKSTPVEEVTTKANLNPLLSKSVFVDTVDLDPSLLFNATKFFHSLYHNDSAAVWLDSETVGPTKEQQQLPRNSYFAAMDSDGSYVMESHHSALGTIFRYRNGSSVSKSSHLLSILNNELEKNQRNQGNVHYLTENSKEYAQNLPFVDGYFGFLGYELGKEISEILSSRNGFRSKVTESDFQVLLEKNNYTTYTNLVQNVSYPSAFLLFPSRYVVFNHQQHRIYVVAHGATDVTAPDSSSKVLTSGQELKSRVLNALALSQRDISTSSLSSSETNVGPEANLSNLRVNRPTLVAKKTFKAYEDDIHKCLSYIRDGETYEVCLTVQFKGKLPSNRESFPDYSLNIYQKLRAFNPAPYSAYLRYNATHFRESAFPNTSSFAVCCTSPEQYLRQTNDGVISSKPIKGTLKRARHDPRLDQELAEVLRNDPKSHAENLMIVDLVRNDLGRISEIGSVTVPILFGIESYSTVHQLVSTIQGKLCENYTMVDALVHTFPPGSMTGAPKLRTMQIIEELEQQPRGIYSGTMGFIGLNGVADLNVVIRTAVVEEEAVTIGAGGAIVAQSDPHAEIDEVLLKAKAVGNAIGFDVRFAE